jgi:hypothetical protein
MYYPKSQITTNLYTNGNKGDELYLQSDGSLYVGYYYKTSNGSYFSGKTPQDIPSVRLIPSSLLNDTQNNNPNLQYINTSQDSIDYPLFKDENILIPYTSPTLPTQQDYQIGEMRRYFCKKSNEISYLEISKDTYDKLIKNDSSIAYQYYTPFNISWLLTGNKEHVYTVNNNIVELAMKQKKLPQFDLYLKKDYTKYYK